MAPEQIEGRECDARSDIFSLGTVLYLLGTGELPFQGRNPHQVLKQIGEGNFRDPMQLRANLGGRFAAIIRKCLQIDPALRYPNAGALEADLLEFVGEAGIQDPGESLAEYLKDPEAFARAFRERVIETQIALADRAYKAGNIARATDAWNRVLAYDENNARVLAAVQRFGRRSRLQKALWLGGLSLVGAAAVAAVLFMPKPRKPPKVVVAPPPVVSVAPAPNKTPVLPPVPAPNDGPAVRPDKRPSVSHPRPPDRTASASATGTEPRHVVLRPEPANVAISVDGSLPRDFGPSFRELDLAPGSHTFKFVGAHECCVDEEITVKVPPGPGTTLVEHHLQFRPAGLYVVSNTPANVVVDGGNVSGRTRSVIQVPQPGGMFQTHSIRITADGHKEVVREVRLRAGQVETIDIEMEKSAEKSGDPT
jgi:serine/threonine-protein kinase